MSRPSSSLLCPLLLALAAGVLAGCSNGVDWSARERANAAHIRLSLEAVSEAAEIANAASGDTELLAQRERLLRTLRAAHVNAARVEDSVLDKLHPQLYAKFRLDYQRALARMIQAYEQGDVDAAQDAAADIRDFIDWYRRENHTFRWWEEATR